MCGKNRWRPLRRLQLAFVMVSFALALVCAGTIALGWDVDLQPNVTLFLVNDIVGLSEQEFDIDLPVDAAFSIGSVDIDLNSELKTVSSQMRLDTLSALHAEIGSLPASALKDALNQSLSQADAAIDVIRNIGDEISIDALYDELKVIEKALDAGFIDLVDDSLDIFPMVKARLLVIARPIEQRYDYLKYITNKVRLYARDPVSDELAGLLRQTVDVIAHGDSAAYLRYLSGIIARVENYRGMLIKQEEADRIRYKADLLLRKVMKEGVETECGFDLATTLADVEVDGAFSWEQADYHAPSKDVRTDGLDLTASYVSDDWDASIGYRREWRDYTDRLKDDNDRMRQGLDISVSYERDPYSADISPSFDEEFYPNDIDGEIEEARVSEARAGIVDLLELVYSLQLSETLEAQLVKDLGEEGALGALDIWDRSEAVDCLNDFIKHVLAAEWTGDMDRDAALVLIAMARNILPRKRIYSLDVPLAFGFPFHDGDAVLALKWEREIHPANAPSDHATSTGKLSYTRDVSMLVMSGYLKREELVYPHAAKKNYSLREWLGAVESDLSCGDLGLTFFGQRTAYPQAPKKDRSVRKVDADLNMDLSDVSVAFHWDDKLSECPDDADKPTVREAEVSLEAAYDTDQGEVSLSWSDGQEWNIDGSAGILVDETRRVEISLDGELLDYRDFTVSGEWTDEVKVDPDDPGSSIEAVGTALDASFDLPSGSVDASFGIEREWKHSSGMSKFIRRARSGEVEWDGKITDDLDLTLSLTWKNVTDWADPTKDSTNITIQAELALAL